ncbi:MAG: aldehyde:ferredoxin oxidoreductase, partial [Oscillospiraceae bacterium]|nr:aldehyde:ferredoxin oxidoreductase [Oscillospiraceae bacterium]
AVSGNHEINAFDNEAAYKYHKMWTDNLKAHPLTGNQLPRMGTAGLVSNMQLRGILSSRNYAQGQFEGFEKVSGEALAEDFNIVNKGCLSCPMKCSRTVSIDGRQVKGPELETLGLLGGGILNDNMELIFRWNNELDELGLDAISCAGSIAWAMEANEKGLWDNGLAFGKTDNVSQTIEDIAYRRGIGDDLAEGTRWLSGKYGGEDFAIQSKGLELAAYEPRRAVGQGLGYAVGNRGGCHINGGYLVIMEGLGLYTDTQTPHAKADLCMVMQNLMEGISLGGQCIFTSYALFPNILLSRPNGILTRIVNKVIPYIGPFVRVFNRFPRIACFNLPLIPYSKELKVVLGMKGMTLGEFIKIGERSYNVERAVNAKFGVCAASDTLPKRLTHVPQDPNDPTTVVPLETMKKTYYRARGWEANGLPSEKKLRSLKIID